MVLPQTTQVHCCGAPEDTRSNGTSDDVSHPLREGISTETPTTSTEPSSISPDSDAPSVNAEQHKKQLHASVPRVLILSTISTMLSLLCLCGLTSYLYYIHGSRTASPPHHLCSESESINQSRIDATWETNSSSTADQEHGPFSMDAVEENPAKDDEMFSPVPLISPFVSVWGLQDIPLLGVQNMGTLTLRWGDPDGGGATEMVFHVDSITRSHSDIRERAAPTKPVKTTTVLLSSGHKLVVQSNRAELYDPSGRLVHSMFRSAGSSDTLQAALPDEFTTSSSSDTVNTDSARAGHTSSQIFLRRRRLQLLGDSLFGGIKKPKKPKGFAPAFLPNGPPAKGGGPPTSFMDAYCRYGCGGMSVTFPYYYRPFFGYGFPLVGTEAMFPQGYGGYPAAPLLATQGGAPAITGAGGPVIAGGSPAGSLTSGLGASNVLGGVLPVALPGI